MRRTWAYAWGVGVVVGGRGRLTAAVRWRNLHGQAVLGAPLGMRRTVEPLASVLKEGFRKRGEREIFEREIFEREILERDVI